MRNSRIAPGAPPGKQIVQTPLDGELDAALGEKVEREGVTPLFADVAAEEKAWFAKHRVMPINHMVVVSTTLFRTAARTRCGRCSGCCSRARRARRRGSALVQR